ncbi:putative beta-lysine N-acetyltransferase [Risungbinella massiliensis]|uniref:putative beta-lysine N-acetyltransferase n=1 Tax=Risungbinella massiliensis TaxID=1329796 RepID=UPI0005CBE47C|nr:putative beta-lysine N-acetyltransferase [Risungbinella massiliensis]
MSNQSQKNLEIDLHNSRVKIISYVSSELADMLTEMEELAEEHELGKLSIYAKEEDQKLLEQRGFHLEAVIQGFHQGTDAYIYTRFLEESRANLQKQQEKDNIVDKALKQEEWKKAPKLPPGYHLRHAQDEDAEEMSALYKRVFSTYPTPIFDPEFIRKCMRDHVFFTIVETADGKIVSSASADVFPEKKAAEITDCATDPDHRGKGLLSAIIFDLEQRMEEENVPNLFSLTRAVSPGMNIAISRHGYDYGGRLIQNSQIAGDFEDMNVWVKQLDTEDEAQK